MKTKAHTRYRNANGDIVPGVTTILGVLNKPYLVKWANNLGLEGIDSSKYVDHLARIGTLAHHMVECDLKGETPDTSDYSQDEISKAENSLISYYNWKERNSFVVIFSEARLVSEVYQYGGTIDCLAKIYSGPLGCAGKYVLIDFKTSKAIYDEHAFQLAAYRQLALEKLNPNPLVADHIEVDESRIVRIGRTEDEGFEERVYKDLSAHFEVFRNCLNIHRLRKTRGI